MSDKVIFWTPTIDGLRTNSGTIGGIAVQMNYWAEEFLQNGWKVYSLSKEKFKNYDGISFLYFPYIRRVRFLAEILLPFVYFIIVRPKIVISRGADRQIAFLSFFSTLFRIKYIHFTASDDDLKQDGITTYKGIDNKLYFWGLRRTKYIVIQNDIQEHLLKSKYFREQKILVVPNVWKRADYTEQNVEKDIDFLWVGNFRDIKRPEWFLELAKKNGSYQFAMIGGSYHESLYQRCREESVKITNLLFHGKMDLDSVNQYFNRVKCLVCTSCVEGFPNTFLQAWSKSIPVLTTFDPSGRVSKYGLGVCVSNFEEMNISIKNFFGSAYEEMTHSIDKYFVKNHDVSLRFKELMEFLC